MLPIDGMLEFYQNVNHRRWFLSLSARLAVRPLVFHPLLRVKRFFSCCDSFACFESFGNLM